MSEDDGFLSRWSRRKEKARRGETLETGAASAPAVLADGGGGIASESLPTHAPTPDPGEAAPSAVSSPSAENPPAKHPPAPTLADVELLTRDSDFARFVAPEVNGEVRNAALKKLFSDPHFNVMDGLDTYIDDYNKPDPLPASVLKKMAQAAYLGLVEPEASEGQRGSASKKLSAESAAGLVDAEEQGSESTPSPRTQNEHTEIAAGNESAAATKAHDENPDLRLQSHHAPGPPGPEPDSGEDSGRQR